MILIPTKGSELIDGSGGHQPFYFFVAFKEGSEWAAMPEIDLYGMETDNNPSYQKVISEETSHSVTDTNINVLIRSEIVIYPNPSNSEIIIQSHQDSRFVLLDAIGSVQMTGEIKSGNTMIPLNNLANGVYTIDFVDLNQSKKIVKIQ